MSSITYRRKVVTRVKWCSRNISCVKFKKVLADKVLHVSLKGIKGESQISLCRETGRNRGLRGQNLEAHKVLICPCLIERLAGIRINSGMKRVNKV